MPDLGGSPRLARCDEHSCKTVSNPVVAVCDEHSCKTVNTNKECNSDEGCHMDARADRLLAMLLNGTAIRSA